MSRDEDSPARFERPQFVVWLVIVTSLLGFILTGWLSGVAGVGRISLRWFQQEQALLFLAAWAQIVLAVAVWYQVRAARDSARQQGTQIAQVDKQIMILEDQVSQGRRQLELAEAERDERSRQTIAAAMSRFVGLTSNASAFYISALPRLRVLARHVPGDLRSTENGVTELVSSAESVFQEAYSAYFELGAWVPEGSPPQRAADALLTAVTNQRASVRRILHWHLAGQITGSAPSFASLERDIRDERNTCLRAVREVLGVA
jgi:hypothetical protein